MPVNQNYDLIRWNVPFADVVHPAVWIIGDEQDTNRTVSVHPLTVAVAPEGIDRYPKYLIHFQHVLAYKSENEMKWTDWSPLADLAIAPDAKCTCLRPAGSYWWETYGGQLSDFYGLDVDSMHYYLFGGDYYVEVFGAHDPDIEKVTEPRTIVLKYAV